MTKEIKVLFFASFRQKIGLNHENLQIPDDLDVGGLKQLLGEKYPNSGITRKLALVSINKEYAFDGDAIPDRAEVAFFPPVSGGSENDKTLVKIVEEALDLNQILASIVLPTTGAACIFTGIVREVTSRDQTTTSSLEYQAYDEMARMKMEQISAEIRQRWPLVEGIALIQRVGHLDPGVPTVAIACSAAHRDSGVFEAARYGIDRIKEIVPIWKKEVNPQHEVWVEGHYIPKPGE